MTSMSFALANISVCVCARDIEKDERKTQRQRESRMDSKKRARERFPTVHVCLSGWFCLY